MHAMAGWPLQVTEEKWYTIGLAPAALMRGVPNMIGRMIGLNNLKKIYLTSDIYLLHAIHRSLYGCTVY